MSSNACSLMIMAACPPRMADHSIARAASPVIADGAPPCRENQATPYFLNHASSAGQASLAAASS
jgi:hypothetical protein